MLVWYNKTKWGEFVKTKFIFSVLLYSVIITFIANSFIFIKQLPQILFIIIPVFLLINIFSFVLIIKNKNKRIVICQHGTILLYSFYISIILSTTYQILFAIKSIPNDYMVFLENLVLCIVVNLIIFWNGIISVYLTSTQLGLKLRIIGIVFGMIPIANLVTLFFIIKTTTEECLFEIKKQQINKQRRDQKICATKYPILMVHGVFFRDIKLFNYWGRIPKELEVNGAKIFYGNHSSAASVADSAAELKKRINEILIQTGADKVNIIAHSKGGLDCRYAISKLGIGSSVASLTTINTPHNGCLFADYLLTKIPSNIKNKVASTYNSTLKKFGETNSDFLAAINDLTDAHCKQLNADMPTPEGIYCQSVGSILTKAKGGKFPLNFSYHLVRHFSGDNDGLVSENSFKWGQKYILLKPNKNRGISHGDMIDLNRENIYVFDVREFYVNLVNDLKNRGL